MTSLHQKLQKLFCLSTSRNSDTLHSAFRDVRIFLEAPKLFWASKNRFPKYGQNIFEILTNIRTTAWSRENETHDGYWNGNQNLEWLF